MAIICSHHNSTTLENDAVPVVGSAQKLYHAEEFVAMLVERPVVVAWINGHTHINTIQSHARGDGGGFWEITAASCIDFGRLLVSDLDAKAKERVMEER